MPGIITTIYCSNKLEKFVGKVEPSQSPDAEPILGNWNGNSFHVDGKRCLIFLNDKTCYCILMTAVLKMTTLDFSIYFRERLIAQLSNDFRMREENEVLVRQQLSNLMFCRTNNNRNVNGTMNQHVSVVPYYSERFGHVEHWDERVISNFFNEAPVTTKVWANRNKSGYFFPNEAMGELINGLKP